MKYYFLHDNGVQWFSALLSVEGEPNAEGRYEYKQVDTFIDVPLAINGPFLTSILSREIHFTNRTVNNTSYYGWTLSKTEFDRLKKIVELYPSYLEYLNLQHD